MKFLLRILPKGLEKNLDITRSALRNTGEFAVRGGLIDVYPLNADAPHRIDFFGDEVEQIRLYDPTTQRTLGEVNELTIAGTPENEETDYTADALGFLPTEILWILREASRLTAGHTKWFNHPENFENPHRDFRDIFNRKDAANDNWTSLSEVDENSVFFEESQVRIEHITEPAGNFLTALILLSATLTNSRPFKSTEKNFSGVTLAT